MICTLSNGVGSKEDNKGKALKFCCYYAKDLARDVWGRRFKVENKQE